MKTRERIRQFLVENFYLSEPGELADDTLLVTTGIVDSTGILEVIAFLEAEFGVRIADQEVTPANLESIERMTAFVEGKQKLRSCG